MADNSNLTSLENASDVLRSDALQQWQCTLHVNFIINTFIAGALCVLGFTGNTLSFFVLSRDKGTPVASLLLRALALTDNFFLCAWFLHFSLENLFQYHAVVPQFHISWLYVRVYTYPLMFVGQTGTIWLTVLIAVSRYIAVCKPYHAAKYCSMRMVRRGIATVAVFSFLYNLPRFFEAKFVVVVGNKQNDTLNDTQNDNVTKSTYTLVRTTLGNSYYYQLIYFDVLYYIFSFVLPLVLLIYLNTRLTLVYRVIQRRRRSMSARSQDNQDNNITLVMIVVILVFIVCNLPARVVQLVWGYKTQPCPGAAFIVYSISNVLEVFNSSANFVIYCLFRRKFRRILRSSVCCLGPGRQCDDATSRYPLNETASTCTKTKNTSESTI